MVLTRRRYGIPPRYEVKRVRVGPGYIEPLIDLKTPDRGIVESRYVFGVQAACRWRLR